MAFRLLLCSVLVVLAGCGSEAPDDIVTPVRSPTMPRLVPAGEALATAEIATLDPHTMSDADVSKVLGPGAFCAFRYVSDGNPVLAWKPQATAVVKLNGLLVELQPNTESGATQFAAGEVRLTLMSNDANDRAPSSTPQPQKAKLLFEVDERLRVGYAGYAVCPS